jgi:hypothetical protein
MLQEMLEKYVLQSFDIMGQYQAAEEKRENSHGRKQLSRASLGSG